jgi:hypothetical protein
MTPFKQDIGAEWAIEQRVLKYLAQHGRKSWDVLLTRLSLKQETAIAPVLNALKEGGYIEVTTEDHAIVASITSSGLKRLEAKNSES